jgi:hypothetical protein
MTPPLRCTGKTGVSYTAHGDKEKPRLLTGAELGRGSLVYWIGTNGRPVMLSLTKRHTRHACRSASLSKPRSAVRSRDRTVRQASLRNCGSQSMEALQACLTSSPKPLRWKALGWP